MYSEQSPGALQAFFDFLWSPFRAIKYFYQDLSQIEERLRDDSIAVRVLTTCAMPFRLLGGFLSLMVQNWPTSRSGLAAVAGIPAFFTLLGLLGALVLVDYVRNDSWRIATNQAYYDFNVEAHSDTPESALVYAQKLVDIDPNDAKLKYQLGRAEERAGNLFAADDAMKSIAPDNPKDEELGFLDAHIWRANYLVRNKTAEEYKAVIGEAENHLNMVIAANTESLAGKSQLANLYMNYANKLDDGDPARLEYLIKADEEFRAIIEDANQSQGNSFVQISTLSPSVLVRKQLEALAPDKYSVENEVARVRSSVSNFLRLANRYKYQDIRLWLTLMSSSSEIRQFDFAVDIANQGIKVVESPQGQQGLIRAKSLILRKAALSINNFDDFESYRDRFVYLCKAVQAAPTETSNYLLLLQYIGRENPKPSIQLARQIGLSSPGDAVPIKPEWLYRVCLETEYTGLVTSLIGLHEFHTEKNESAIKNWYVAQQFNLATREFIAKVLETMLLAKQDKLDNLELILSEALQVFPEALRIRMLRGLFYTKEKKFEAAIDDFRVVLDYRPSEVLLHQRIKSCYQYLGQRKAAADEQKIIDDKLERLPEETRVRMRETLLKMENNQSAAAQTP